MDMPIIVKVLQFVVPIMIVCIFTFTFLMLFSPKVKSKMMGKSLKTLKTMMEDNTEVFQELNKMSINLQKNVLEENEEMLKDINRKTANISKDGVEITARAVKKGFSSETIYCKHCGNSIDADSKFCKTCGKEQ